jgi:hypothetical protein
MKINTVGAWFLCYAVVPLLLLAVFIIDRGNHTFIQADPGGGGIGSISAAGDESGSPVVSMAGTLFVRGWVAERLNGAPLENVVVSVDGMNVGVGTLSVGGGWNFQMPAGTLSAGRHSVTAIAVGRGRPGPLGEGKTIDVTK